MIAAFISEHCEALEVEGASGKPPVWHIQSDTRREELAMSKELEERNNRLRNYLRGYDLFVRMKVDLAWTRQLLLRGVDGVVNPWLHYFKNHARGGAAVHVIIMDEKDFLGNFET